MARRKVSGEGLHRETSSLDTLRTPFLPKSPKEDEENGENREIRENTSLREIKDTGKTGETRDRRRRTGYRHKTDLYRKVSYFLTHEQADTIIREAEIRGQEISEFFRSIVDYYYTANPLDENRIRELMEERMKKEISGLTKTG